MTLDTIATGERRQKPVASPLRLALGVAAALSTLALTACMGAPTYGTGTPADQQLFQDVSGVLALGPKDKPNIDYEPRPKIVMPASKDVLPPPQENVTASNRDWPESPEERLARVRTEATINQDNPQYKSGIIQDVKPDRKNSGPRFRWTQTEYQENNAGRSRRSEFNRRLAERRQGSPTQRRYLSEPPLELRKPAASAPVGDVGKDEWRKEREARRAARQAHPRESGIVPPGL